MVQYWYPTQSRVHELSCEVATLEGVAKAHGSNPPEFIAGVSDALTRAVRTPGFPKRQIRQWVWVASQFRLHHTGEAGAIAGSALCFLEKRLSAGQLQEPDVQDLNWVLESTVQKLLERLGPGTLRSCLSVDELSRIQRRLAGYDCKSGFDALVLRKRIERHLVNLSVLATDANLATLKEKVEALFGAAAGSGKNSGIALAALLYLADIPDLVPDTHDFLGLVDDIYVIEWAYAVVENQTRCLPLLEGLIQEWPYLADLAIREAEPSTLDRFSQYVAGACLHSLFENGSASLLVLRESAAHPILCAFMSAICMLRKEAAAIDMDVITWPAGQPITISDGVKTFKAVFHGRCDFSEMPKYRIGVRNGSITVDAKRLVPYMARSAVGHVQLSVGGDILKWLKEGRPDPLIHLTGSSRRRPDRHKCILLVCTRRKLDQYISCVKPLGSSVAGLFGVRYVTARNRFDDLSGSATDTPAIYVTSDVDTALDLIREPPDHVEGWHVIVDGARSGQTLLSSINTSGNSNHPSVAIMGELHEREAATDLVKNGITTWYLEDQDVEAPPLVPKRLNGCTDALIRSSVRQLNHWTVSKTIRSVTSDFLEAVAECMKGRAASSRGYQPDVDALDLQLSAFLRKAISFPIRVQQADKNINDLARSIASQASLLRSYDDHAERVYNLFRPHLKEATPCFHREGELVAIASGLDPEESTVVVCRSAQVADICSQAASAHETFRKLLWLNLEALRQSGPYDRVIVPGWLDRMAMRELDNCGYGLRLDLLLLPFEQKWFEATVGAGRRWERQLEAKTSSTLRSLAEQISKHTRNAILWRDQIDQRIAAPALTTETDSEHSDVSEIEKLEARAIESLRQSIAQSRDGRVSAKAQLVLFDDAQSYAFLPPTGKVIVLSPREGPLDESALARGQAERLLFRSVTSLEPGMILAFSAGGDRDLVDARADQYLANASQVRTHAALWKGALKRHITLDHDDLSRFSQKLAEAGQPRAPATVRAWITQTHTVAPMNFRNVIALIARLTGDQDLTSELPEVLQAIDLVYRARARAAEAIVRELFSGEIDLNSDELCFDLGGTEIRYALHRINRLAGIQEVPVEIIGKVGQIGGAIGAEVEADA